MDYWGFFFKFLLATAVMGVVLFALTPALEVWVSIEQWWWRIALLLRLVAAGAIVYFLTLWSLKVKPQDFIHTA